MDPLTVSAALSALVIGSFVTKTMVKPVLSHRFLLYQQGSAEKSFLAFLDQHAASPDASGQSVYQQNNNETLKNILKANGETEFGTENGFREITSFEGYRAAVAISKYTDLSDKIEKLCNGEKNILSADNDLFYFATSSGTTGKQKMIPVSSSYLTNIFSTAGLGSGAAYNYLRETRGYKLTNSSKQAGITYSPRNHPKTAGGTPYGPLSQSLRALTGWKSYLIHNLYSLINCIPGEETDYVLHFETNLLVQLFFHLLARDVSMINVGFGAVFSHYLTLLENHYEVLLVCMEAGSLSECPIFVEFIPKDILSRLNAYVQYNYPQYQRSERVKELNVVFAGGMAAVVPRIWPGILYVSTVISGAFAVYEEHIRSFLGEVPIMGAFYVASETVFGFQFNVEGDYCFNPSALFLEFIPEDQINAQDPQTILLDDLEVGKSYELVITTLTGFYRYRVGDVIHITKRDEMTGIPLFKVAYRTGSILDAYGEKTTEAHVEEALKRIAASFGLKLENFTSFLPIERSPVVYQIFVEFNEVPTEKQRKSMSEEVDKQLRAVHLFYDQCREQSKLGCVECHALQVNSFMRFKDELIAHGTAPLQVKIPKLIKKQFLPFIMNQIVQDDQ